MNEIEQIIEKFINQTAHSVAFISFLLLFVINYFHRKENRIQNARIKKLENSMFDLNKEQGRQEERTAILENHVFEKKP